MSAQERAKRVVARIYDRAASTFYEPVVVRGTFRLFGGRLHSLVAEQARSAAAMAAGRPILDLPVGTGYFTRTLAAAHLGTVVGADIAYGMTHEARRATAEAGFPIQVVQADAHRLPFRDGTFGALMCTNGLQVMPGVEATLRELRRVLARDGTLYVSVVNIPAVSSQRAPGMFMSRHALARLVAACGFDSVTVRAERFATLFEAR